MKGLGLKPCIYGNVLGCVHFPESPALPQITGQVLGSRNGSSSSYCYPWSPRASILLPASTMLGPADREVLVPRGTLPQDTAGSGRWGCHLATLAPHSRESAGQGVTVLFGVTHPDSQEKTKLQPHNGGQGGHVRNAGFPGVPLRTPIGQNSVGNHNSPTQAGLLRPGPSGRKVWVTPPGKEPGPAKEQAERRWNREQWEWSL